MRCILGKRDETRRKKQVIYYLSKKFNDCESRYTAIKRLCCTLVWSAKRLKQYMIYFTTWLISKLNPLYIYEKPYLSNRIKRWQMLLEEYDIVYMIRKAVKESMIVDHLANHVMEDYELLNFNLSNRDVLTIENNSEMNDGWTIYFDGVVNVSGDGAGVMIISLEKKQYPVSMKLQFENTNNMVEYEVCIINLEAVLKLKVGKFDVYRDSLLIICQVKGE